MKSSLNNACISAVLCGAVLMALPAVAAGVGGTAGGGVGAGATTGAAGTSLGTGVNTTGQVTTPAGTLNNQANANANAATALNTNRVGGSVSTGGMTTSGDLNSATAGNNAGSVNTQSQTQASRLAREAQNNANAATNPALSTPQASVGTAGTINGSTTSPLPGATAGITTTTTTGTLAPAQQPQ